MIVASATLTVEARRPPKDNDKRCDGSGKAVVAHGVAAPFPARAEALATSASVVVEEDTRPTTPGHSPGAGHSLHNKGVDKNV
ncbi:hypothetical protein BHM03_00001955 [Ensete ventricosum]|nr:hypothetical protein BHM03_00001955 [Ensete ventricosum]